jgi:hypothetical protein
MLRVVENGFESRYKRHRGTPEAIVLPRIEGEVMVDKMPEIGSPDET